MTNGENTLMILAGVGLAVAVLVKSAGEPPECTDTTWICDTSDRLEHSNCGNTLTTTPCSLASDAQEMITDPINFPPDLRYDVNDNGIVDPDDVALLMGGTPLRTLHPTNITVTSFPPLIIPPGTYNTVDIDITWTNTGEQSGSFIPQIIIGSGALINLGSSVSVDAKATYNKTARLTSVPSGSQSICPISPPDIMCYRGVVINATPCPWSWDSGNFWVNVMAVPAVGETWIYQNCYPTLIEAEAAIDALYNAANTFNQC